MKMFVISDTHFNHENIIKYCNRPFNNISEMNEYIIRKWNETVTKDDLVYHLGDFGFGTNVELKELLNKLNGTKILLFGNHDLRRGINAWKEIGFKEVYKKEIILGKFVLTHSPIQVLEGLINIFGHIHNKELHADFDKINHINVSADVTNFRPIIFDKDKGILD